MQSERGPLKRDVSTPIDSIHELAYYLIVFL